VNVKGYTVITSDDKKAGRVVDETAENLIVEYGTLRKTRKPLPRAFAHVDPAERVVRATVSSQIFAHAPGPEDGDAVKEYYGLTEPTAVDPDDIADDATSAERARLREHLGPKEGPLDQISSIGITGGERSRDAGP
jgi:hypothetical protein